MNVFFQLRGFYKKFLDFDFEQAETWKFPHL